MPTWILSVLEIILCMCVYLQHDKIGPIKQHDTFFKFLNLFSLRPDDKIFHFERKRLLGWLLSVHIECWTSIIVCSIILTFKYSSVLWCRFHAENVVKLCVNIMYFMLISCLVRYNGTFLSRHHHSRHHQARWKYPE